MAKFQTKPHTAKKDSQNLTLFECINEQRQFTFLPGVRTSQQPLALSDLLISSPENKTRTLPLGATRRSLETFLSANPARKLIAQSRL